MASQLEHHSRVRELWSRPQNVRRSPNLPLPSKGAVDAASLVLGLGLGATIALYVLGEANGALKGPGGLALAITRASGLIATYMLILVVLLAARVAIIERTLGQDKLIRWHRKLAPYALVLLTVHVALSIYGYAKLSNTSLFKQLTTFVLHYPDMLMAIVGYFLLIMAGVTSYKRARAKMKYETWWVVHLYTYLGVALAVAHQVRTGVMFLNHPLARDLWVATFIVVAEFVLWNRLLVTLYRNAVHRLKIVAIVEEGPGVYSVTCQGKHLEKLPVSGGQFIQWRFLSKDLFLHSHPYSLSAMPRPPYIRVTIKDLGDHSGLISKLKIGTRVFIEGPYGAFTRYRTSNKKVTLIGAGVGATPIRALLEDMPPDVETNVILRGSSQADLIHNDEIAELMANRRGKFYEVTGSRSSVKLDAATLKRLVPEANKNDFFICGPVGFIDEIRESLSKLGITQDKIHLEEFAF